MENREIPPEDEEELIKIAKSDIPEEEKKKKAFLLGRSAYLREHGFDVHTLFNVYNLLLLILVLAGVLIFTILFEQVI